MELHSRAARVYLERHQFIPAIDHLIASRHFPDAFRLAVDFVDSAMEAASFDTLASMLSRISREISDNGPDCQYVLGRVAASNDHYRAAQLHFSSAIKGYESSGNNEGLARALKWAMLIELNRTGNYDAILAMSQKLERLANTDVMQGHPLKFEADLYRAMALGGLGRHQEAMGLLQGLLAHAREEGAPQQEILCLDALVMIAFLTGDVETANSFYNQSKILGRQLGRPFLERQFLMAWSLYFLAGDIGSLKTDLGLIEQELARRPEDHDLTAAAKSLNAIYAPGLTWEWPCPHIGLPSWPSYAGIWRKQLAIFICH